MTTVALRLPDDLVEALDEMVREGRYSTRTEVIRTAIDGLMAAHGEIAIDRSLADGYRRVPQTDEEVALATAVTRALIEEEPW